MGRKREYDPEHVMDSAMMTFWQKGFEGTSVRDLAKSCGLTTRSMYNAYPDKDIFFEAALDHYHERILTPIIALIESKRGFQSLKSFALFLGENATSDGCLFINTASSRHLVSREATHKIERYVKKLKASLRDRLIEEQKEGKFIGNADLGAAQIVLGVLGFNLALKSGISKKDAGVALLQIIKNLEEN